MKEVSDYYDRIAQTEWERLDRHRTEFALTMRAFKEHLPSAPAQILDVGGGPGTYAIALARLGYGVTIFDLSRKCLGLADKKAQEAGVQLSGLESGNATDLSRFKDRCFDAVLLMGPLYHLLTDNDRLVCIRQAKRVLKTDGVLFGAFITRYAPIRDAAKKNPNWIVEKKEWFAAILDTGVFSAPTPWSFATSYFATPSEVRPLFEREGFRTLDLIACEGLISGIEEKVNDLSGEAWEAWVDLNYDASRDPSIHGTAEHLLWIGQMRRG